MNSSPDAPVYNLKVVVCETGLKPDTIRAWERRYGLPEPGRTDSGHRLYSHNEIQMLKWLVARQNEGMSISKAVVLWQRLQENNTNSSKAPQDNNPHPLRFEALLGNEPFAAPVLPDALAQMRNGWVNACLQFDEQAAEQILAQAFALFPVEQVCIELLQQGLTIIGEGWYQGKVTVQQEHFASTLVTRRLEALLMATPQPTRTQRILIGCPPSEMHGLAPLLLTLLLRRRGWDVLLLGTNVPLENLIHTIRMSRPQLVILVAQQLNTAANLLEMGQLVFSERVPMAYGGRIFIQIAELRPSIPGHYLGDTMGSAVLAVESLLAQPRLQSVFPAAHSLYQTTLEVFKIRQPQIEAEVAKRLSAAGISHSHIELANQTVGREVTGALAFGDPQFLLPGLRWLHGIFTNHDNPSDHFFAEYVNSYLAALELYMGVEFGSFLERLRAVFSAILVEPLDEAPPVARRSSVEHRRRANALV